MLSSLLHPGRLLVRISSSVRHSLLRKGLDDHRDGLLLIDDDFYLHRFFGMPAIDGQSFAENNHNYHENDERGNKHCHRDNDRHGERRPHNQKIRSCGIRAKRGSENSLFCGYLAGRKDQHISSVMTSIFIIYGSAVILPAK